MRIASPSTFDSLNQATASEPTIIIQINWGGGLAYYSTKSLTFENGVWCDAKILTTGELSHTRREDNFANTGSMSFTLDDSDGQLKFVIDATRTEKRPAAVYLHYEGNGFNDLLLLLKGELIGPISWSEGQRTLNFSIEIVQDHSEFGFSPTQDDFPDLTDDAVAIPWPVAFGKVAHVPAVHVRRRLEGTLMTDIRLESNLYNIKVDEKGTPISMSLDTNPHLRAFIPKVDGDPSTTEDTDVIYIRNGESFPQNVKIKLIIDNVIFQGTFKTLGDNVPVNKFAIEVDTNGKAIGINLPRYKDLPIAGRHDPLASGFGTDGKPTTLRDKNGNVISVPQYNKLWLKDGTKTIVNHWVYIKKTKTTTSEDWVNYCSGQNKTECSFKYNFRDPSNKWKPTLLDAKNAIDGVYPIQRNGYDKDILKTIEKIYTFIIGGAIAQPGQDIFGHINPILAKLAADKTGFWNRPTETIVRLYTDDPQNPDPDLYICNLAPVSKILGVYARRTIFGKKVMVQVPESYYKVLTSNYQIRGSFVTALEFDIPLLDYKDQKWEDTIYVSMLCGVGPLITDVLKWIFKHYTSYAVDTLSFSRVEAKLSNWPVNFAIYERRDALKIAAEIAWQSRCALIVDSDVISIVHLADQPNILMVFNSDNVEFRSATIAFSETREISTKLIGTWTESYKDFAGPTKHNEKITTEIQEVIRTLTKQTGIEREATRYDVYRENIDIFGTVPREERIYIYNNQRSVWQTLKFWGHRFSNVWKKIKFKTFMPGLLLQPFDCITINLPQFIAQYAYVERISFNPESYEVIIEAWTPILAGGLIYDGNYFTDV